VIKVKKEGYSMGVYLPCMRHVGTVRINHTYGSVGWIGGSFISKVSTQEKLESMYLNKLGKFCLIFIRQVLYEST
jgi:hypothetical protein